MKTRTARKPYPAPRSSPAVKYYGVLTVFWMIAALMACVIALFGGYMATHGGVAYYGQRAELFLVVPGAILGVSLLGVLWYTKLKKAPALTATDAWMVGFYSAYAPCVVSFMLIANMLFEEISRHHLLLASDWLPQSVPILLSSFAPAYWFWRAKRMRAKESLGGSE